jgi:superfamily II DNA or RNA helicase
MQLRDYQEMAIEAVRDSFRAGHRRTLLVSPTGSGKCYGRGTPILMYDGSVKPVEDIAVGDLLMGPDSTPRRVESLARGREEMFRITPIKGDPFECNRSHILCLRGCENEIVNIEVNDYLQRTQEWKDRHYGWRVPGILSGNLTPELTEISVQFLGEGDYYGFTLSGPDRMHLLGDFTVGHNTLMFSYIAAGVARNGKRVLIIAHRRELLRQISTALQRAGVKHGMLVGGSTGIPPHNVIVASVFTLANRLKHFPKPDLIIGDEAHHFTPDSSWGKVVAAFPEALVLGVTATPERLDGKGLGVLFEDMVIGPTVAELTEQEYLSPADVYAPSRPDMQGVHTRMGDYVKAELEQAMDRPSITGSAVAHYRRLTPGKKAIAFCVSVKHAQDVADDFRKAGFAAYHIDGGMKDTERDKVLKDFESGEIQVLTSCDLVSEGFDLPAVEVAILLRPTQSLSLYLQQCLDSETEILTQRGWIGHADITDGDIVASKDMQDGAIKWGPVRSITRRPLAAGEKMFSIESPHLNIRVTGGHDMIARAKSARAWVKEKASITAQRKGLYQIPVSGIMDVPDAPITDDELRLLGWFLSDGSRNKITNCIYIAQSENKTKHLSSIQSCIEGCGIKYGRCVVKRKGDYAKYASSVMFTMSFGKPRGRDSHLSGYGHLDLWMDKTIPPIYDTLSARQLMVLLETLNLGDGSNMHQPKGWVRRTMSITTGDNEHMADRLQAILVTRGFRCNKGKSATTGKKPQFFLYINSNETSSIAGMNVKDGAVSGKKPYKRSRFVECDSVPGETVWCVETDYGTLISRRRGRVAILGNCGRAIRPAPGKSKTYIFDHAGNTARHGFIDEPRDWTLDADRIKQRRAEAKEKPPEVRTCPECFAMHATLPVCPKCGHVYQIKSRKIQQIDGELVQLSHAGEARAAMEEKDWKRRFDVLTAVGRKRGYQQPTKWAFNVICGQEATRLAKARNANRTTNGLTSEERTRIWEMTMGRNSAA